MPEPRRLACGAVLILLAAANASGQEPAKFYDDNCAMCHAIGGPPGGAPDLKDVTKRRERGWLVRFILDPEKAAATDPDAAALVKEFDGGMPATEGATPDIVERLLQYIDAAGGAPASTAETPAARVVTAADIAAGRDLYQGRRALVRRAPACVSCHRIGSIGGLGGGTLGPDLTLAHQRLGGAHGLATWLSNPPTRVMRAVYRAQPLAEDERFTIASLLVNESAESVPTGSARTWSFVVLGLSGALAMLTAMALIWSRRMTAVRRPLVDAARRRVGDDR